MNEKFEDINKLAEIRKQIKNTKWKCAYEGCSKDAINSHILQRNGILNYIQENGHVYEIQSKNEFSWLNSDYIFEFKKHGITQKAMSLDLFCNHHDTELFKPIEQGELNLDDYNSQLLFCLRNVYAEFRKKEIIILYFNKLKKYYEEKHNNIFNEMLLQKPILQNISPRMWELKQIGNIISSIDASLRCYDLGLNDLHQNINLLKREIESPKNNFIFLHRKFPFCKIGASSIFSLDPEMISNPSDPRKMADMYFSLIPQEKESHILLGYYKDDVNDAILQYYNDWASVDEDNWAKLLTGLLSAKIESWCIAPSIYEQLKSSNLEMFFGRFDTLNSETLDSLYCDFNLFDGII